MKIVLYNIAYGTGNPQGEVRRILTGHHYLTAPERPLVKIGNFLKAEQPDAAGLVETDLGSPRTRGLNQPEVLAEMLGMTAVYRPKYAPGSRLLAMPYLRDQGNAVLVRDPAPDAEVGWMPRGMKKLILSVRICGIRFYLVHLALTRRVRSIQLEYLAGFLKHRPEPIVVAGDFNTFKGVGEVADLCRECGLVSANAAGLATYPAWAPVKVLDHILYSESLHLQSFTVPHLPYSDHLPLVAEFSDPGKSPVPPPAGPER